jgi:hypothetical protein
MILGGERGALLRAAQYSTWKPRAQHRQKGEVRRDVALQVLEHAQAVEGMDVEAPLDRTLQAIEE